MTESTHYTGWKKWTPTVEEWSDFYLNHKVPFEMLENEYLIIYQENENPLYYCYEHGEFRQFRGGSIKTYKEKTPEELVEETNEVESTKKRKKKESTKKYSKGKQTVLYPKNDEQTCAFDLIKNDTKTIKLITGGWGCGKTLILVAAALEALKEGKYERIVWIRNNISVKDTSDLGALPGTSLEKLLPFLGPFIDHAGESAVKTMLTKESLKVEPLQFLRGRNFENTLILCSESENLTKEHIQLIIARAAEGSQVWFDGDNRQRDKVVFEKSQGLEQMIEKFSGNELFGHVHLIKSERSETAAMADLLD